MYRLSSSVSEERIVSFVALLGTGAKMIGDDGILLPIPARTRISASGLKKARCKMLTGSCGVVWSRSLWRNHRWVDERCWSLSRRSREP